MTKPSEISTQWFCGGGQFFPAMLAALAVARESVELEIYIFADDEIGRQFLAALTRCAQAGVRVRVLVDACGSLGLSATFFAAFVEAGGEIRFFNPLRFNRFGVRDHRKQLICDRRVIFVGGANIANNYDGDGVTHGWFDVVARLEDASLAARLAEAFDHIFSHADFTRHRLPRLRVFRRHRRQKEIEPRIFAIKPGRGTDTFQRALQHDLARAMTADFIIPYFLPNRRMRKLLRQIVRRGGRVRLILPALSDVPLARAAGQVYYSQLMSHGVEIYEYQPQILHAKIFSMDEIVFVGSSNLDVRSFKLNYELMLRLTDEASVSGVKKIFAQALKHSRRIDLEEFRRSQNPWQRWKNRWAHFLLARIDPLVALRQFNQH